MMGIHDDVLVCRTKQRLRELHHMGESGASPAQVITDDPTCQHGDIFSQGLEKHPLTTLTELPEDILRHIHFLMPVEDAARAACVSHGFLRSWRCYPKLIFNNRTLGLNSRWFDLDEQESEHAGDVDRYPIGKIEHALRNHSGTGVKVLKLELFICPGINASHVDRWLEFIIKPGTMKELALGMPLFLKETQSYNFPCSLLSNKAAAGGGSTLESLCLSYCAFHPTPPNLGFSRSLTRLDLRSVHISDEELEQFLSNCVALEKLVIFDCDDIMCVKVPRTMQQLHYLELVSCRMLKVILINAPKLSTFIYGDTLIQICITNPFQVKHVSIGGDMQSNVAFYARTELQSILPSVETLNLSTHNEGMSTPMAPSKFLYLKYLNIFFFGSRTAFHCYDLLSMVSFLDASPSLETFILRVHHDGLRNDSILEDSDAGDEPHLRRILECRHDSLKDVTINGFTSSKSMIELTVHILENAPSLECITLDTVYEDKSLNEVGECSYMSQEDLLEAQKALVAITRFVEGKVPSFVNFKVLEPCGKCHADADADAEGGRQR